MQFTPQQISGGPRYGTGVKIGNWNEERSRVETESKDYELKKSRGQLATSHKARQKAIALQRVPHSFSGDGLVHFGQTVMLELNSTDTKTDTVSTYALANDVFDRVDFAKNTILVTASPDTSAPVARNTFVLVRPYRKTSAAQAAVFGYAGGDASGAGAGAGGAAGSTGDVLRYGDRFFLASNPSLRVDDRTGMVASPYLLMSEISNAVTGSGKGKARQDVVMTLAPGGPCEWTVVAASGDTLATEGLPVKSSDKVMIVHCATNQALAGVGGETQSTDYGVEVDLHAFTYRGTGMVGPDKARPALEPNRWSFRLADDPADAVDDRGFKPLSAEAILLKVREIINTRGEYAIRGIGRSFRIMDDRRDGKLDREDFKWGLYDYGVKLTDEEFDILLDEFDRDDDGTISFTEFLVTLRGPLSERRLSFIREAFSRLDKDGSSVVTLSDLVTVYDTSFHPEVQAGRMTHEECVSNFMSQWDTVDPDGVITFDEFVEYYKDVSASIDTDDYFELMMRNAWHISGGEGALENTTCLRVLVIHSDGGQEVVEVKDDLGLDTDDMAEIRRRLESQGVEDIASIEKAM